MAVEPAVGDPGLEGIARPPAGERIDVDVTVQHDGAPAARAVEARRRLLAPRLDLLELGRQPLVAEIIAEPFGARRLLGGEGRDADQVAGEPHHLVLVDTREHLLLDIGRRGLSDRHCISSLPRSAEQYTPPCYTGAVKNSRSVYSTDKGRLGEPEPRRSAATPAPSVPEDGVVRIFRERGGRNGKVVTVLRGLPPRELEARAAELKRLCGAGGAAKEGVVEIQGDHRDRIAARLRALGHRVKLAGG